MIQGFYTRMQESCYIMRLWPYNIAVQREITNRGWQGHWSWVNTHITGQRSQPDGSEKAPTGEQKNLVLVIHPTPKGKKKASYFYRISHFVRASNKTEEREKEKKRRRKITQPRPTDAAASARRGNDFTRSPTRQEGSISPHTCVAKREIHHELNTSSCNDNNKPLTCNVGQPRLEQFCSTIKLLTNVWGPDPNRPVSATWCLHPPNTWWFGLSAVLWGAERLQIFPTTVKTKVKIAF